jgi:hypothetical protein
MATSWRAPEEDALRVMFGDNTGTLPTAPNCGNVEHLSATKKQALSQRAGEMAQR